MKKGINLVILFVLCLLIAAGAYFWATGMIASNYSYHSPLKDTPPSPGQPLGDASTDRVVVVLIDALRYDTSINSEIMPVLNDLRHRGASATMHSQPPSFSEPGYSTLLTGAWPALNDGPTINLEYEEIPAFTQDNLFSAAHRKGLKTAISGYYWFEKLVPQQDVDYSFYTPGEDKLADREVVDAALPWLTANEVQLMLIHIDQVDYAGHHEGGASSANWDEAAKRSDDLLAEILSRMDLSKDTIVVLSDHGQIDAGGHGGNEPVTLVEPFVMAGKGIKPGAYGDIQMVDVAPTLAALLGTNLPASTQGTVLTDMLDLPDSVLAAIPSATRDQQTSLLDAYISAMHIGGKVDSPQSSIVSDYQTIIEKIRAQRLFADRLWRSAIAAVFLAVITTFLIRSREKGSLIWVIGGVITFALFNFRYALIDHKTYSLSSVTGEMDLILYVGVTTVIAFTLVWLLISLTRKIFRMPPLQAAMFTTGLGLTSIFILFLPVVVSSVLNGPWVTWTLPEYTSSFFALLGLIQILLICVLTPILAGITSLISYISMRKIHS